MADRQIQTSIRGRPVGFCAWSFALACALGDPAAALAAPGAALGAAPGAQAARDPFQPINRFFFAIHEALDFALIRPAAIGYKRITPRPIRTGLHNAVINIGEPSVAINDFLQGHGKKGVRTLTRFAANTTFGVFGLFDLAAGAGIPHHANDFGITLARYGVQSGPYLFVPLVGPTTVRDAVGSLVGIGLNPLTYVRYSGDTAVGVASVVSDGLYARAAADQNLKALSASATDLYASFRSYYLQNRAAEVNGGRIDLKTLPDFDPGGQAMADLAAPQDEPASSVLTQPKAPLWPKSSGPEDIEPPYRPQSLPDARDRALSPDQGSGGFDAALGATIVVGPPLS